MTMPHLGNCPHKPGTWCLACVREEWERREAIEAAKDAEISALRADLDRERRPWTVTLVSGGELSRCEVVDVGVADRILIVECGDVDSMGSEIAALRERCGRLANEVMAWRRHDAAFTLIVGVAEVNRLLSFDTFYRTSGEVCEAMQQVKDHNDLAPPKGDNDG